jgi:methionyl-tRNA formyltransferase
VSRTAFLGSPESAVPALEALASGSDVALVLTRPDRVRGRGKATSPTAVKVAAIDLGIAVAEPTSKADLADLLEPLDLDLAVVAAFGMIIPAEALAIPRLGMVNVHYSLLPRWRGAAPVERAIIAGDDRTGITLMQMDAGLDTGPILSSWETGIAVDESGGELTARLSAAAGEFLAQRLPALLAGTIRPDRQSENGVTYASMLSVDEARLDPSESSEELAARIRAFDPRPGARFARDGEPFKVFRAVALPEVRLEPGRLEVVGDRLAMGTGTTALVLGEVQPAGKRRMEGAAWARGVHGPLGLLT